MFYNYAFNSDCSEKQIKLNSDDVPIHHYKNVTAFLATDCNSKEISQKKYVESKNNHLKIIQIKSKKYIKYHYTLGKSGILDSTPHTVW